MTNNNSTYFLCVTLSVLATILLLAASSPVLGGSIRGIHTTNRNVVPANTNFVIDEVRRMLNPDVDVENSDNSESASDDEDSEDGADDVPMVRADCADHEGLVEVAIHQNLACRQVRKSKLCDRKHNGQHLYESCQKSCGICVELYPTTDAPTEDLLELLLTEVPTDVAYTSSPPSMSPTAVLTEEPTPAPSQSPTLSPTTMIPGLYELELEELETAEPTYDMLFDSELFLEATTFDPLQHESAAPTDAPTIRYTDDPTATPSKYPTTAPTNLAEVMANLFDGLDDDAMLEMLGELN